MDERVGLAIVGVGRMGFFHALHAQELCQEDSRCALVAVVDTYEDTAQTVAEKLQPHQQDRIHAFRSVVALLEARLTDAAVVASRTDAHVRDAWSLIQSGHRVLLEKPLSDTIETAAELADRLDRDPTHGRALMQAFMRRFDPPLQLARDVIEKHRIGHPFKIVSVLEDPLPPPESYRSPGILPDMAIHNIDEVIWLSGHRPVEATALGARIHSLEGTSLREDFDDALVQLRFPSGGIAQIQVSRNHVAGYRNETWVYGDRGMVHVGRFEGNRPTVSVEVFDSQGRLETKTFPLRDYGPETPEFIFRFGPAYKRELAYFVERCLRNERFCVTHRDGLAAMQVAMTATRCARAGSDAAPICYGETM